MVLYGKRRRATYSNRRRTRQRVRRLFGRKTRMLGFPRGARVSNIHHFKRVYKHSALVLSSAGASSGALYCTLGSVPNVGEFTSLFDQYRINKVVYKFVPTFSENGLAASGGVVLPNIHVVADYDDSVDPVNTTTLMQYQNYRMWPVHKIRSIKQTPAINMDIEDGTTTATGTKFKQWINCSDTDVKHRGLKYYLDQSFNIESARFYINIFAYVYFSCKGVR